MLQIATTAIALVAMTVVAATQAAATNAENCRHAIKSQRHAPAGTLHDTEQQRSCSWVGPGGRAIYVCR